MVILARIVNILLKLSRLRTVLQTGESAGLAFPVDFGFIPSTLADDGGPADVMVLMDEPAHVGCLLDVRLIGVIEAQQVEKGKATENDRLIGVALHSYNHQHANSLDDVDKTLLDQGRRILHFLQQEPGQKFKVRNWLKQELRSFERRNNVRNAELSRDCKERSSYRPDGDVACTTSGFPPPAS